MSRQFSGTVHKETTKGIIYNETGFAKPGTI